MNEPNATIITPDQVADIARVQALKPVESDFKNMPGYYQREAKVMRTGVGLVDGYEWGVDYTPNDGGKLTRAASEIGEAMKPFQRADTERHLNNLGTDWQPRMRVKGQRVMVAGRDGRVWKLIGGKWVEV